MTTQTRQTQQRPAQPALPIQDHGAALLDKVLAVSVDRLAATADRYATALADRGLSELRRAMILGNALDALDKAITPEILKRFVALMGTDLGFKTDRDARDGQESGKASYPDTIVKRCIISGLLQGVTPFFNQMNIISHRCYVTKEGYEKKCRELPGLKDLEVMPGVPYTHNGQTAVRVAATWTLNGKPMILMGTDGKPGRAFPIIVRAGATPDNIIGKAKRKALAAVYAKATGSEHSDFDPDEAAVLAMVAAEGMPEMSDKAAKLAKPAADPPHPTDEHLDAQAPPEGRQAGDEDF